MRSSATLALLLAAACDTGNGESGRRAKESTHVTTEVFNAQAACATEVAGVEAINGGAYAEVAEKYGDESLLDQELRRKLHEINELEVAAIRQQVRTHSRGTDRTAILPIMESVGDDLLKLARDPQTPSWFFQTLVRFPSATVIATCLENPALPKDIMEGVMNESYFPEAPDCYDNVKENLAKNTSLPANMLTELSKHSRWAVRSAVAGNSSTPASVLATLSHDNYPAVKQAVATNCATSPEILLDILKTEPNTSNVYRAAYNTAKKRGLTR